MYNTLGGRELFSHVTLQIFLMLRQLPPRNISMLRLMTAIISLELQVDCRLRKRKTERYVRHLLHGSDRRSVRVGMTTIERSKSQKWEANDPGSPLQQFCSDKPVAGQS